MYSVVTTYSNAEGHISRGGTIVGDSKGREKSHIFDKVVGNVIPLGSTCFLCIFNTRFKSLMLSLT